MSGVELRDPSAFPDDVNAKVGGRTALHDAAWDGDLERIEALLAAGADPSIDDDEHGGRPLAWAEYAYQEEAAALLRRHTPGMRRTSGVAFAHAVDLPCAAPRTASGSP